MTAGRAVPAALAILAIAAATAVAATVRLHPGATYTGRTCTSAPPGMTCILRFRATRDGRTLHYVGATAIDTYRCPNGGGEALLGGRTTGAAPIPALKLAANGSLRGSVRSVFHPTSAPAEHHEDTVTGRIGHGGRSAVIVFHSILLSGHRSITCSTPPVTLTAAP